MCRSIKTLRSTEQAAAPEEVRAAALQFVRKISGYRVPSRANAAAFDAAVDEIAASADRLLASLVTTNGARRAGPAGWTPEHLAPVVRRGHAEP